jgi:hypothetical protein
MVTLFGVDERGGGGDETRGSQRSKGKSKREWRREQTEPRDVQVGLKTVDGDEEAVQQQAEQ